MRDALRMALSYAYGMAKYNPFAEKARMQKSPIKSVRLPNTDENTPVFKFE
jgi:hypothetical protein